MIRGLVLLLTAPLLAQQYDLLIRGGHVIDPKNRVSAVRDVAIQGGKIAQVAASIDPKLAGKVIDAAGLYVTPGIIDIHVHVYAAAANPSAYCGPSSVFPDGHSFRNGVTTVVDAGTSGWKTFEDFKTRVIDISKTRVLSMLNIVGTGMCGGKIEQNVEDMEPAKTAEMIKKHPDIIVGVKTAHYAGPEWTAVEQAVEAGKTANVPVMVDFGSFRIERPYEELVLKKLRPGDIYTHMYLDAVPMLDKEGKVRPYLLEARKRGIIFDVGHGGGSFVFWQAVPAMRQGFVPDSISTDLHTGSMNSGMKGQINVMSKFLNMGMSVDDVILRSTWNPAKEIKREDLGHLTVGAIADVAVLRLSKGPVGFVDVNGGRLRGNQLLSAEVTLKDGKVQWDANGMTREDWDKIGGRYPAQGDASWDGTINSGVRRRPSRTP